MWTRQDDLGRLDQQRAEILAAALGDATKDGPAAGAVLSRHQAEPGRKIAPALKGLSHADRGDDAGGDDRSDPRYAHQALAFGLDLAEFFDRTGDGLDALVQPAPVFIETNDAAGHSRRYLVPSVLENGEQGVAKGAGSRPDRDPLLDEKGSDLVDRCRATRHQSRPDAMTGLQIELVLAFLLHRTQVRPQRGLGNRLGIVVIVLLPFNERSDVDRWDDPRLVSQSAEHSADKMRAQTSFHANDTRWQLLERVFETESSDLLTKGDLPIDTQSDDVKNLLADIDTDDRERRGTKVLLRLHCCFSC